MAGQLGRPGAKSKLEEIAQLLELRVGEIVRIDTELADQERKKKYDRSAHDAIENALRTHGFDPK